MNTPRLSRLRERLDSLSEVGRARVLSTIGFTIGLLTTLFLWFYYDHTQALFWSSNEGLTFMQSVLASVLLLIVMIFSYLIPS